MENNESINPEENTPENSAEELNKKSVEPAEFENPDVDPGFDHSGENHLTGREDKRSGNIDSDKSISEMREDFDRKENDARNLNNDRDHGSYNPKNI